jgi:serralysin
LNGNMVVGNDGSNTINGGDGNDQLTGRGGWDLFWFDTELTHFDPVRMVVVQNVDTITDFNVADDTIVLENAIFGAFSAGSLAEERFVVGTAPLDASDTIIYDIGTGNLFYDSDGNGSGAAPIQFARVTAGTMLTYLDFLVV